MLAWYFFHIHHCLFISHFHSSFPFFLFLKRLSVFSLSVCFHLVAQPVGPKSPRTKYFEDNSFTHEDVGEALDFVIARKRDYSKYSRHKLMEDIGHCISHLITEKQHINVLNIL